MGRSITPPYRLVIDGSRGIWRGRPSQKALNQYVYAYIDSLRPGGANEHIGQSASPRRAWIETNSATPTTLYTWTL
jgi:hypothetical protein